MKDKRWGGPKRENHKERDGTSECYRWLAKCDLMTKTGYGYAKCLTVAGTATSVPLQEIVVLEHPETTVPQNRSRQRKDRKKKEERKKKRVSSRKDCSVGNGKAKSMISPRRRLEGIDEKRERQSEGKKEKRKEREKREKGKEKEKRIRVSTHLYPPPSDVRPRTSRTSVGDLYLRCDVRRCADGEG